jgi:hypothetical protein
MTTRTLSIVSCEMIRELRGRLVPACCIACHEEHRRLVPWDLGSIDGVEYGVLGEVCCVLECHLEECPITAPELEKLMGFESGAEW